MSVVRTPRTSVRVVCGRLETIETFEPTSLFTRVDLPTLGRPTTDTNPLRNVTAAAQIRLIAIYKKGIKDDLNAAEKKTLKKLNENW